MYVKARYVVDTKNGIRRFREELKVISMLVPLRTGRPCQGEMLDLVSALCFHLSSISRALIFITPKVF
jgi:hypothetical protein